MNTKATTSPRNVPSDLDTHEKNERTALLPTTVASLPSLPLPESSLTEKSSATGWGSVFNLVNSAVGSGVLSFPWAYRSAGLGLALLVTAAAFVTTQCTQIILIRTATAVAASKNHRCRTLQDLVHESLGRPWATGTSVVISLYIFGACCSYMIILCDALRVLSLLSSTIVQQKLAFTIVSWVLVFPLCLAPNMAALEKFSATTMVAALFILAVVAIRAQGFPAANDITWFHLDDWLNPHISPLNAPPVAILAFQAHIQTVPILYELGPDPKAYNAHGTTCKRHHWSFRQVQMSIYVGIAGGICLLLYSTMGVCGYLTFGDHSLIQSNILDSYNSHTDNLAAAARLVVGLVMVVSYPVNQFCAQSAILDILAEVCRQRHGNGIAPWGNTSRQIVTFLFFTSTFVVALFVQDLGLVFDIIGATVGVYVIMLLPAALVYNDPTGDIFPFRMLTFVVLAGVGLAICGSTLTMHFSALLQNS